MFADWTDRIAGGETPPAPPRPQGIERNVVITMWDWADPKAYLHDLVSTDRRNPTVNAYGPVYGVLERAPTTSRCSIPEDAHGWQIPIDAARPETPRPSPQPCRGPRRTGATRCSGQPTNVHNPMIDEKGRVWLTARVRRRPTRTSAARARATPPPGSSRSTSAGRHLAVYDPATKEITHVSTCFGTHHLMFAEDENNTSGRAAAAR
jgi:hypothetical protein